jgi:hypothetical protein
MRVMLMIKGDPQPGAAPSEELLGAMGRYNEELKEAVCSSTWRGCSRAPWGDVCGSRGGTVPSSLGRSPS